MYFFLAGISNFSIIEDFCKRRKEHGAKKCTVNVLLSYYYEGNDAHTKIFSNKHVVHKAILDSGGFTVIQKPNENFDELKGNFFAYLKNFKSEVDDAYQGRVMALDLTSKSDEASFHKNFDLYDEQYQIYASSIPVIHNILETSNEVEEYAAYKTEWMAIGQCENRDSLSSRENLKNTIVRVKDSGAKCHLLGTSAYDVLKDLSTLDSYDSKSWLDYARFGIVEYFYVTSDGKVRNLNIHWPELIDEKELSKQYSQKRIQQMNDVKKIRYKDLTRKECDRFNKEMYDKLGLNPSDFLGYDSAQARQLANIYYELEKNAFLNRQINKVV